MHKCLLGGMIVCVILFGVEMVTGICGRIPLLELYDKRSDVDLQEDLGYPSDWRSILSKKDETIATLTLENKVLNRRLNNVGAAAGGWAGQILEKVKSGAM